jgi:hypothetical protein
MIIFFAVVLLQTLCFAQDGLENLPPPPKEKPKEADLLHGLNILSDESHTFSDPTKQSNDDQRVDALLIRVAQRASEIKSKAVIDAIIAFPEKSAGVIAAKVHALGVFEEPVENAIPFLVKCLSSDPEAHARGSAAAILIKWGREWDKAIQEIYRNNNYYVLHNCKDPRAIDVLRYGVQNGTFYGRMKAAHALQEFGDSTILIEVSKYVLENAPSNSSGDKGTSTAKYQAIQILERAKQLDNISALERSTSDESSTLVRMESLNAIALEAYGGNISAYEALQRIAQFSTEVKQRGEAKMLLERLKEQQRKEK